MTQEYGPTLPISREIHQSKYRMEGETFLDACNRQSSTLADNDEHRKEYSDIILNQRFMPAGRVQSAIGSPRRITPWNCFVSGTINDSFDDIMDKAKEAGTTMRLGGGIGYDFSTLRPRGERIKSVGSQSSGPVSFMDIFDSLCGTIASAGHRRGAQMGVMRVDHPDIIEFIHAKRNSTQLTRFNISVGVTDAFMEAVKNGTDFNLKWRGRVVSKVDARKLWEDIMRSTWDWAEPGVLFIDRINEMNNLWYCETITSTNPCLHPDTLVETVEGRVKIKDIKEPTQVYTMKEDGSLGIARATASWVSRRRARTLKITVNSGKEVICTPDHKIYVDGYGWSTANNLKEGDCLVHLCRARRGAAYSGVKLTTEENRAYRMEHRMIAEAVYGEIPDGYDVHHVDENTYNNSIDNLEILCHKEHATLTRHSCDNNHMVSGYNEEGKWRFISPPTSRKGAKDIIPMPDNLKSSLKNKFGACVSKIEEGPVTDVYDLEVEGTHNFIANFLVVHNCAEQPLPPYGACLLGSFNLVKYVTEDRRLDLGALAKDIPHVVRAMDNIIDVGTYPLPAQEEEGKNKRRMGLGFTGVANAIESMGRPYASEEFLRTFEKALMVLTYETYRASIELAKEKGPFPLFDADKYLQSKFIQTLPDDIKEGINKYGIRNSHLTSIAPTGTISLSADNVSSGIEPVFTYEYDRTIQTFEGPVVESVQDYGYRVWGTEGRTADQIPVEDHVRVLSVAQQYMDSACSKTCNVGDDVDWERFKDVYILAYNSGAKGCTTFRAAGKRYGILNAKEEPEEVREYIDDEDSVEACYIDPNTGQPSCS